MASSNQLWAKGTGLPLSLALTAGSTDCPVKVSYIFATSS